MTVKPDLSKYRKGTPNAEVWGRDTARQRYGNLDYANKAPPPAKDMSKPQDPIDRRGPANDHRNDWVRGANEDATTKPGFDRMTRGPKGGKYHGGR
jgi:hypothetical protein